MLTKTLINGTMPGEDLYRVDETVLDDETDYLAVPLGYNLTLTAVPAEGDSVAVFVTTKESSTPDTIVSGDWESVTQLPTFGTSVQVTWAKVVATGDVTVRGWMRKC